MPINKTGTVRYSSRWVFMINNSHDACNNACNTLAVVAAVEVADNKPDHCSRPGRYIPAPAGNSALPPAGRNIPCSSHGGGGNNGPVLKHCRQPRPAKPLPELL